MKMMHMKRNKKGQTRGNGAQKPSWHIGNKLQQIDLFGKEVPSFNLKGETHINTKVGGLVSALIIVTALLYAVK